MIAIVIAGRRGARRAVLARRLVGGAGFGVAFLGGLRALSVAIPPQHRAEVMSAFYVVAYLAISVPAIVAGVLVTPLGLEPTFEIFGSVVAALAWPWPSRPTAARPLTARVAVELA